MRRILTAPRSSGFVFVPHEQTRPDDPDDVSTDPFDVYGKLVPDAFGGVSIASAWITRYQHALEFLTEEAKKAGFRISILVRCSLARARPAMAGWTERDEERRVVVVDALVVVVDVVYL